MAKPRGFKIDLAEEFPTLARAPIVEAVIHWRARAETWPSREELLERLKERLPDYPKVGLQHELQIEAQVAGEESSAKQSSKWLGFRCRSEDERYIAQFNHNGLVFSRLAPYENWNSFATEAQRLWGIYVAVAGPTEVQRLGVRFINLVAPVEVENLGHFLRNPPRGAPRLKLPIHGFLHQSTFDVPGYPYRLKVIQTIQPQTFPESLGLILDIDAYVTQACSLDDEILKKHLAHLRWLKNKAFFSFLKQAVIDGFKEAH